MHIVIDESTDNDIHKHLSFLETLSDLAFDQDFLRPKLVVTTCIPIRVVRMSLRGSRFESRRLVVFDSGR